jgi:hypothetical protein
MIGAVVLELAEIQLDLLSFSRSLYTEPCYALSAPDTLTAMAPSLCDQALRARRDYIGHPNTPAVALAARACASSRSATAQRHDGSTRLAGAGNDGGDLLGGLTQRIVG